jgi:vacuolar-type H+-ATPase subunit H
MQKVWDELKKIEAQAEQIQAEAQTKAKDITALAKQQSEQLLANSKTYGEEEAAKIFGKAVEDANACRSEMLRASEEQAKALRSQAEKRLDKAVSTIVKAVLEESPS